MLQFAFQLIYCSLYIEVHFSNSAAGLKSDSLTILVGIVCRPSFSLRLFCIFLE